MPLSSPTRLAPVPAVVPAPARPALAWKRWAGVGVIAATFVIAWASGLTQYLDFDRAIAARESLSAAVGAHPVQAAGLFFAVYVGVVALSLPGGLVLSVMSGFLFGGLTGGALAVVAATVGSVAVFIAARTAFADGLRRRAGPMLARIADGFDEDALSYLLFLRLVPLFPFWLVNLAPALLGVRLKTYVIATIIGIIPGTLAFAFVGAGLDSLIAAQMAADPACATGQACVLHLDPRLFLTRDLILAFVGLGIVALIPVALKRFRGRGPRTTRPDDQN